MERFNVSFLDENGANLRRNHITDEICKTCVPQNVARNVINRGILRNPYLAPLVSLTSLQNYEIRAPRAQCSVHFHSSPTTPLRSNPQNEVFDQHTHPNPSIYSEQINRQGGTFIDSSQNGGDTCINFAAPQMCNEPYYSQDSSYAPSDYYDCPCHYRYTCRTTIKDQYPSDMVIGSPQPSIPSEQTVSVPEAQVDGSSGSGPQDMSSGFSSMDKNRYSESSSGTNSLDSMTWKESASDSLENSVQTLKKPDPEESKEYRIRIETASDSSISGVSCGGSSDSQFKQTDSTQESASSFSQSSIDRSHPASNPSAFPPAPNPSGCPPAFNPSVFPPAPNPSGCPPASNPSAFPPAPNPSGSPPAPNPSAFPPAPNPSGFPPARHPSVFPPAPNPSGSPPAPNPSGCPPAFNPSVFPPARHPSGFPPAPNPSVFPSAPNPSVFPPAPYPSASRPAPNPSDSPPQSNIEDIKSIPRAQQKDDSNGNNTNQSYYGLYANDVFQAQTVYSTDYKAMVGMVNKQRPFSGICSGGEDMLMGGGFAESYCPNLCPTSAYCPMSSGFNPCCPAAPCSPSPCCYPPEPSTCCPPSSDRCGPPPCNPNPYYHPPAPSFYRLEWCYGWWPLLHEYTMLL